MGIYQATAHLAQKEIEMNHIALQYTQKITIAEADALDAEARDDSPLKAQYVQSAILTVERIREEARAWLIKNAELLDAQNFAVAKLSGMVA